MSEQLAAKIKRLIATAIARGHVTFDELNEVMPAGEYTSEQIEDVTAMFAKHGIELVEFPDELRPRPVEIDLETACERSIHRIETAIAALRRGRVRFACQLMEASLTELQQFAAD